MQSNQSIRVMVLVLLSLSLLSASVQAASESPPSELPEKTEFLALTGAAINPGWNYLTLGTQSCSAGAILDEFQADAGGGVRIGSLWAASTTSLLGGQSWKEYTASDEKSRSTVLSAGSKLALYSGTRFYIDLSADTCTKERPVKQQMQIQETRTAAVNAPAAVAPKANESIGTKITAPARRIVTWLVGAWTGGVTMVWNQVTKPWGRFMKK
ncbi:hypothetical protein HY949_03990 [Candidatus Gottesmanbacteria bacterium]|nr:hypothetical protein [Candidatus Gottesmanbacteria bacterium]